MTPQDGSTETVRKSRPDYPATVPEAFARSVAARRSHPAIVTAVETVTYQQLDDRTLAVAASLVALGAGKGTRIAIMAPDSIFWLATFLAAMRIGALVTPISTLCSAPELLHLLRHSDAQILIAQRAFLRHDYAERLVAALPSLADARAGRLHLPEAPYLRSIWLDDAAGLDWAGSHEGLLVGNLLPGPPPSSLVREMEMEVAPSDDAVVIYTSGSTALPKAVVHSQRTVASHSCVLADIFCIDQSTRMMPLLPLFWVGGLQMSLEVLQAGATLVYPATPSFDVVLDTLITLGVNRVNTWGPQMGRLRQAAISRGLDVDAIGGLGQWKDEAGAPIPAELIPNLFGMTESFGPHSGQPINKALSPTAAGASGQALGGIERRVVDRNTGEILGPGDSGELQLRGGAIMKGFYKTLPEDVFTPDGFYPTNDIVRIDDAGHLYFECRRGDMMKVSGANVSRLEVESALRSLPEVELPIVVGLSHPEGGQLVAAAVVLRSGANLTESEVKEALHDKLSSFKIPRHIIFISMDDIALTPSNKVKLEEIAKLLSQRIASRA